MSTEGVGFNLGNLTVAQALAAGFPGAFAGLRGRGGPAVLAFRSAPVNFLATGDYDIVIPDPGDGSKFTVAYFGPVLESFTGNPTVNASLQLLRNNGAAWATVLAYVATVPAGLGPGSYTRLTTSTPVVDPAIPPALTVRIVTPWSGGTISAAAGHFLVHGTYD